MLISPYGAGLILPRDPLQRLYGFDLSYIQDVYAILDAAKEAQTCHKEYGAVIAKSSMPKSCEESTLL